jgi:hypothetical protein
MSTSQKPVSTEDYKLYIRELKKRNLFHTRRIADLESSLSLHKTELLTLKTHFSTLTTSHEQSLRDSNTQSHKIITALTKS